MRLGRVRALPRLPSGRICALGGHRPVRPPILHSPVAPGRIYFWRYTAPPALTRGWHIAFDPDGHSEVLRHLQAMGSGGPSSFVTSVLSPSAAVRSGMNMRGARAWAPQRLRFERHPNSDHWAIQDGDPEVVLTFGLDWRDRMQKWLADPERAFDTSVGGNPALVCWGLVDKRHPLDGDDHGGIPPARHGIRRVPQ